MLTKILNKLDPANTPTPDYDGVWEAFECFDINYYHNPNTGALVIIAYPVQNGATDTTKVLARWVLHASDKELANDPTAWVRSV